MTEEQIEIIDDSICRILIEHGPDGHCDGHEYLTPYICQLLSAERERCAKIADDDADDIDITESGREASRYIAARIREVSE